MIKVEGLSLIVNNKTILDNINFEVEKGNIIGLLGHNAAGKSTLQRIIANDEIIQSGKVVVNSKDNKLGTINDCTLITEKLFLNSSLSIIANLNHINTFEQLDVDYVMEKLKEFDINENQSYGSLSTGSKQIVHILVSLSKKSLVYLFDEPLSTIDIFNRKRLADLFLDAQDNGATIIITTHLINEFQLLFDRILYLHKGKLAYDLLIDEIFEKGYKSVEDFIFAEYGGLAYEE